MDKIKSFKKEREKRRVKKVLTSSSENGIMAYKIPFILFALSILVSLFLGGFLIGKLIVAALIIAAIVIIIKGY